MSTRSPRRDAQANRERILDVADPAFERYGERLSMHALAKDAGVGIGTLYRHFPTQEELVVAISRRRVDRLVEAAADAVEVDGGFAACRELFLRVGHGHCDFALAHHLPDDPADASRQSLRRFDEDVAAILRRAQSEGDADPELTGDDVIGLLTGFLQTLKTAGRSDRTVESVADLYLRAVRGAVRAG